MNWIWYILGAAVVLITGLDIFLTILYARSDTGLISPMINRAVWHIFRRTALTFKNHRDRILSFCGPTLMVTIFALWVLLFITGFALIIWPQMGNQVTAGSGPTPTDFWSAFYYSGYSFSTLGTGDLVPQHGFYRLIMIFQSVIGFSSFTLVITYFLNVYSALHRRNTFALSLHGKTLETADPAEYVSRIGSDKEFIFAQQQLAGISSDLSYLLESHHFYPILHYFRFMEIEYGLPRILLISMDAVSLLKSTLHQRHSHQINSAAAEELWKGGTSLLSFLSDTLLPETFSAHMPDDHDLRYASWRPHYFSTLEKMKSRGIEITEDPEAGFCKYIKYRRQWDAYVIAFCHAMLYDEQDLIPFQE